MRTKFICGNWKMNGTLSETRKLVFQLGTDWEELFDDVEVAICPPFTALYEAKLELELEDFKIKLGAQNCYIGDHGAFTGEISASMLTEIGCTYVILGHSERRTVFEETDDLVARKLRSALDAGLKPILCIGETDAERQNGETEAVLLGQIAGSLANAQAADAANITIAYEPVWAIGTGKTATPEQAQEAHAFIRSELRRKFGNIADAMIIQYGGSIKPENAFELFSQPDIDGGLIGGASLSADSFLAIVRAAASVKS
jgi:triosephosphate isomerase (TIM)